MLLCSHTTNYYFLACLALLEVNLNIHPPAFGCHFALGSNNSSMSRVTCLIKVFKLLYLPIIYIIAHWYRRGQRLGCRWRKDRLIWSVCLIHEWLSYTYGLWFTWSSCQRRTTNRRRYPSGEAPAATAPPSRYSIFIVTSINVTCEMFAASVDMLLCSQACRCATA